MNRVGDNTDDKINYSTELDKCLDLNEPRLEWCDFFMHTVDALRKRSCCLKLKTACILTSGTQIISMGYNGTFSGEVECIDYWYSMYKHRAKKFFVVDGNNYNDTGFVKWLATDEFKDLHREWSAANEIHAETNALAWITPRDNRKYIMYTWYSPCDACAKEIIKYKKVIKTVYYKHMYKRGHDALKRLKDHGIICKKHY